MTAPAGFTGAICGGGAELLRSEPEGRTRWCFGCRKRVEYTLELWGDRGPSYWEPYWVGRCPNGCGDRASGGFWYVTWNGGEG